MNNDYYPIKKNLLNLNIKYQNYNNKYNYHYLPHQLKTLKLVIILKIKINQMIILIYYLKRKKLIYNNYKQGKLINKLLKYNKIKIMIRKYYQ